MISSAAKERAAQEMAYCENILAKSGSGVLLRILPAQGLKTWKHYPEKDVYDHATGAQWYYHCHDDAESQGEHGHFHCFVRPDGPESSPCHLIAISVDARGKLRRLFTVNQWVVGGQWYDAERTNGYLERFNIELADPDFLVNRWLTAVVTQYEAEIIRLNLERDSYVESLGRDISDVGSDRNIEILSALKL
ncbi:hypothetical protein QBD01_001430 [Ochrobactrum sp. 19YEA23]|uniref:DUF6969 family protein n=1 Tax=Ochrobactrum sp. 19YEA23 TaxID=3039854 RepID=UPI002478F193|nr:hypothetical protein [Ochrobactrum sp. 19YEA23]